MFALLILIAGTLNLLLGYALAVLTGWAHWPKWPKKGASAADPHATPHGTTAHAAQGHGAH